MMIRAAAVLLLVAMGCCCHAATTYTYDALGRLTSVVYSGGATIQYAYDALGNRTSRAITGAPGIAATGGTPQIANINTAFGQPLQVKVTGSLGNGMSGATVVFTPPASGASANCTTPAPTDAAGNTQTTCTANGVAGSYVVSAAASGIAATALFSLTNYPGASGTTVTLVASSNPAFFGSSVTLTATVTGNQPTGAVNFMIGGISISGCAAQPLINGTATCAASSLAFGNNNVNASYSGDGQNAAGASSIVALLVVASVGLPDTGQDTCYNDSGADGVPASDSGSVARDAGTHPRQDCRFGRDAAAAVGALSKIGAGAKGRDYSKIANNGAAVGAGTALGTAPSDWACTRDNITGLTWEVKTNTAADLRYQGHQYSWRNTDNTTNGGNPGDPGTDTCSGTLPSGQCNTQAFVAAVNAQQLCGFSDWRLPSWRELMTLLYMGASLPAIDSDYFPNTPAEQFWTGTTFGHPSGSDGAWQIDFQDVNAYFPNAKTQAVLVRLVRGGPF